MSGKKSNGAIAFTLLLAVFLWGGSNVGSKYVVKFWPAAWTGGTRLLGAGLILLAILKWTRWLGSLTPLNAATKRELWLSGGLSLGLYLLAFNWALHYTTVAHVALYLGMSPIWTLLWDGRPEMNWRSVQRYGAAGLALSGVIVLFWPALSKGGSHLIGEFLGFAASWLWANYGRQCRALSSRLSGAEISAHTMWRGGVWLMPIAALEIFASGLPWRADLVLVQGYCLIVGGVCAYVLWNNALLHWPTSKVFLFNNLIPITTMAWAYVCLKEEVSRTFWLAMLLVLAGVLVGQAPLEKILGPRWVPTE